MEGEALLASFLEFLLERLSCHDFLNFAGQNGIRKSMEKWKSLLYVIYSVLYDAEEKQLTNKLVKLWLDNLRDLAYDVEDSLGTIANEMLQQMILKHQCPSTSKVWSLIPTLRTNFNLSKKKRFMLGMKSEIDEITDRLLKISERKDKLGLKYVCASTKAPQRSPSSFELGEQTIVGRDGDKAKIVEFLSRDGPSPSHTVNFDVVAIVGMPGVGKTTLAQFVFNDNNDAVKEFKLKVWVSVSDEFDIVRVTRAILESVTSRHCDLEEFNNIQERLSKELAGKKFLIVLDDVWNTCDYDLWTTLQFPFQVGARGSKIIVTTRDAKVANTVGAIAVHNLECISNDDCWKMFERGAFLNINSGRPCYFGLLQEKIIAKCKGLPLAVKTLSGILQSKEIEEWEEVLNNKLWSVSDNNDILPVLKVSYHYLPSKLKRCFAYCSILPHDYEFGEKQLILLWMAEGLINQGPEDKRNMEDLGGDYFQELLSRSLFQKSSKNISRYVMHDLVGDSAQWAMGEVCFKLEDKMDHNLQSSCFQNARHLSYIADMYGGDKRIEAFSEAKRLRTFLPLVHSHGPASKNLLASESIVDLLLKFQYLRVLSLDYCGISELPHSINKLRHLRYLDLSFLLIRRLPESLSTLYNLQTLILKGCSYLEALPTNMKNLISLRHLENIDALLLQSMPPQFGRLTNLQTLNHFVVSREDESGVGEIGALLHLRETLCLSGLHNVLDVEDARRADIISKEGLDELLLEWTRRSSSSVERGIDSDVLDVLQPHINLKKLSIRGYNGLKFATWIGDPLFASMVQITLSACNNCQLLPPLGQLSSLKELYIRRMSGIQSVGLEFYGDSSLPFQVLKILVFEDMENWKEWFSCQGDRKIRVFPCLQMLSLTNCRQLEGKLPVNLDSLAKLEMYECEQLVAEISKYKLRKPKRDTGVIDTALLDSMNSSLGSEARFSVKKTQRFSLGLQCTFATN